MFAGGRPMTRALGRACHTGIIYYFSLQWRKGTPTAHNKSLRKLSRRRGGGSPGVGRMLARRSTERVVTGESGAGHQL